MNRSIACIAFKNDKILIAHRNSSGQMCNRWEFPGGKVEEGETDSQAEWVGINEIPKDNFVDSDLAVYPQIRKFLLDNFK